MSYRMLEPPNPTGGYEAPGARYIARGALPPPAASITPSAPGSNFMSYGPGVKQGADYAYNSIPARALEDNQPEAAYDIRGGAGYFNTVQLAGAATPPSVTAARDETVSSLGLGSAEMFWLGAAALLYFLSDRMSGEKTGRPF